MLVLSRKKEQQIHIGDNIIVTVLHIKGSSVRLGIQAPKEVRVMRSELSQRTDESVGESESQETGTSAPTVRAAGAAGPREETTAAGENPAEPPHQRDRRQRGARSLAVGS